ncbi:MAG: VOC family protein [Thaumarchaeota archaeon]|nr:VOC family protein [Nitrososphaerota archaeon]
MNIKHLGSVIIAVSNMEKSVHFYKEIIGLPVKNMHGDWAELGRDGATLILHSATRAINTGTSIENGIVIGLVVGDIETALQELKSKKVEVYREIASHRAGKNCIILDPDNYMISLFEPSNEGGPQQARGFHGFAPV